MMKWFFILVTVYLSTVYCIPAPGKFDKLQVCALLDYCISLIVLEPDSVNVIVDSSVHFSCTGIGDSILYFVNDTTVSKYVAEGFLQTPDQDHLDGDVIRRNLTLTSAKIGFNNTKIHCRIEDLMSGDSLSNYTIIQIQGMVCIASSVD